MKSLIFSIMLLLVFKCYAQKNESYFGQNQVCTFITAISKRIELTLFNNNTYLYIVKEFNSEKFKLGLKNDTLTFKGNYSLIRDTLILFLDSNGFLNSKYSKTKIKFVKEGNLLKTQKSCMNSLGDFDSYIEYLKPFISK